MAKKPDQAIDSQAEAMFGDNFLTDLSSGAPQSSMQSQIDQYDDRPRKVSLYLPPSLVAKVDEIKTQRYLKGYDLIPRSRLIREAIERWIDEETSVTKT